MLPLPLLFFCYQKEKKQTAIILFVLGKLWEDAFLEGFTPFLDQQKNKGPTLTELNLLLTETKEHAVATIYHQNPSRLREMTRLSILFSAAVKLTFGTSFISKADFLFSFFFMFSPFLSFRA